MCVYEYQLLIWGLLFDSNGVEVWKKMKQCKMVEITLKHCD